MSSIYIHK